MPEIYFPHLGIKINELSRVAFSIGKLDVYFYGLIIVSAILIGYFAIEYTLKKQGKKIDDYITYIICVIIFSFIGARAYYVIFSWEYYSKDLLQIFNFRNGGLGIYGGVLAAILTTIIYCKIKNINFFWLADLFAPYLILGQCMGRWGNFFNKEAFGGYTDNLFSMAIRVDSARMIPEALRDKTVEYFGTEYLQVHPTFLYESVCSLIIFIILLYLYNHKHFEGEVFVGYITMYSFARFFVEGLRTDQLLICNVPISQIVAVCLFVTGIILYFILRKNKIENVNDNKKVKLK